MALGQFDRFCDLGPLGVLPVLLKDGCDVRRDALLQGDVFLPCSFPLGVFLGDGLRLEGLPVEGKVELGVAVFDQLEGSSL
jgi:hypothetical protein